MTAAIYARYSSHAQNDASIEQQVDECRAYAAAHGLRVVAVYADRALSGRSDRRPEFQRMMRAAEKRDFEVVIAYKSNRISRSVYDALRYEKKLNDAGVKLQYCKEDFGDNAAGRMALLMMMTVNQFYSENMAEDIRRGMEDNARQCKVNGAIPFGYKRGDDGRFAEDELTAPIVREIFTRIAAGDLKADIARDLNARGIRTGRGGAWNKSSFRAIIGNERYTGVYQYQGVRIEGGMPALITRELFDDAQHTNGLMREKTKARRRNPDVEYMLTGKLFCGECGAAMVGTCGTSKTGTTYHYYKCTGAGCRKKPVRQDLIERVITEALMRVISTPEHIERLTDMVMQYKDQITATSDLPNLEAELVDVKRARANIMKAIELGGAGSTTLNNRLMELETSERDLLTAILREKRALPDFDRDHVQFFFERFAHGRVDDKKYRRTLLQGFLHKAYVYDDRVTITFTFADGEPEEHITPLESSDMAEMGPPNTAYPNTPCLMGRVFGFSIFLKA